MANVSSMKTYYAGRPTTVNGINNPVNMSNKPSSIHFTPAPNIQSSYISVPVKPVGHAIG